MKLQQKRVVIIGGGITGLAAAYRLEQIAPELDVALIERDTRLGGKIVTECVDGFVIEGGADSFLSRKPRGVGLCEELGVAGQLYGRNPAHNKTYVRRHGRLHCLPAGLTGMVPTNLDALADSTLISAAGRARLAQEPELPPAPHDGDESIASFISRRLGREVYENLVEPLMGGIYAGDGEQLSLAATFPQLRQLELRHGSLLDGLMAAQANGVETAYPPFVSFPAGMGALVEQLLARLARTTILTGVGVAKIDSCPLIPESVVKSVFIRENPCPIWENGRYLLSLHNGQMWTADAVIVTTPAFVTAELVRGLDPVLAEAHAAIPCASSATVSLAYAQADLPRPLDGYGYVIPRVEGTDVLACTWTSSKWEGRAPAGRALLRVYLGRYGRREVLQDSDEQLLALARAELETTLGITAVPQFHRLYRWPRAMPQYVMGHMSRLAQIERRLAAHPGLFVSGAAYDGVGIPDCIRSGETAAKAVVQFLESISASK